MRLCASDVIERPCARVKLMENQPIKKADYIDVTGLFTTNKHSMFNMQNLYDFCQSFYEDNCFVVQDFHYAVFNAEDDLLSTDLNKLESAFA